MSARYLCLQCWRLLPEDDLFCACEECDASLARSRSGQVPTYLTPDPGATWERRRIRDIRNGKGWGDLKSLLFVPPDGEKKARCPSHPNTPLLLSCECDGEISPQARLESDRPVGLGFVGTRSAGKTVLLTAMVQELQHMQVGTRTIGLHGIGGTNERFGLLDRTLRAGEKPGATRPEGFTPEATDLPRNFAWEILSGEKGGKRRVRQGLLAVYDLSGETWTQKRRRWAAPGKRDPLENFRRYLGRLGSMVFLLDGAKIADDLGIEGRGVDAWDQSPERGDQGAADRELADRLLERLGDRAGEIDVALTISKADLLWEDSSWQALQQVTDNEDQQTVLFELLQKSGRAALLDYLTYHFREVRLFAVSSLGFRPSSEDVEDKKLLPRPKPAGIDAPLRWLLEIWSGERERV